VAATAERRGRGAELAALRRQGLARQVVRRVALVGYPALGLAAVGLGMVTGALLDRVVPLQEGAAAAAPPGLYLAVAGAGLAFLLVAVAMGASLVAAVRRGETSWSA
jgi:hypothetical protein